MKELTCLGQVIAPPTDRRGFEDGVAIFDDRMPFFEALCHAVFFEALGRPQLLEGLKAAYPDGVNAQIRVAETKARNRLVKYKSAIAASELSTAASSHVAPLFRGKPASKRKKVELEEDVACAAL